MSMATRHQATNTLLPRPRTQWLKSFARCHMKATATTRASLSLADVGSRPTGRESLESIVHGMASHTSASEIVLNWRDTNSGSLNLETRNHQAWMWRGAVMCDIW